MVNWSDPAEIAKDSLVFQRLIFAIFGVCLWELFTTCGFEWSLITRRLFFFLSRYCILFAFIGLIISLSVTTRINCNALYTFNGWAGNMTILCASTSLMLRTMALWERRKSVVIPLSLLCAAHWGLLYRTMFIVHAAWEDTASACVVVQTNPGILNVTFFFTMGFDFVILCFTAVALISKHTARTDLWKLLFNDGLVYFLVTFSCNCIPAVLNILNLNTPMNVIATVPAALVSSIASGRAVMRLLDFHSHDVYVHSMSGMSSGNTPPRAPAPTTFAVSVAAPPLTRPEVHVTTEHFTMHEYPRAQYRKSQDTQNSLDLEAGSESYNGVKGESVTSITDLRAR
ncbi:uncharacterized protein EV420DRAFT_1635375 [Desarmillaria tabescens]|uniref:Uncharacterized protein n=1 Tax=Armillaria tabescens TaxID=1929756 RepID=A0AA39TRQ2_ARMTA|nr:uncharacterized protein EV420DRAFT_1635375 [Desarmillaria tabescens]KAK0468117.1 hypothetical protein EV420DRAFT_1635375 [Desarmillaria tabescens]